MRKPDETPRKRREPRPLPTPDAGALQAAALHHLAKYAATEAGLMRVLQRRVDRWARQPGMDPDQAAATAATARQAIAALVKRLAASGAISDQAFAQSRARSLARAGRSRRAIGAHLANRGVPGELAGAALPQDAEQELAAALIHARKRRLGPWRKTDLTPELRRRELANLARAGYPQSIAARALAADREEAEVMIVRFRDGL